MLISDTEVENRLVGPQKVKHRITIIQQFDFWVYTQKNWKQGLKEICVHACSQKHYANSLKAEISQIAINEMNE